MKRFLVAGALALAVAAMPSVASAAPFVGTVDYTGTHTPDNTNMNLATSSIIADAEVELATDTFALEGMAADDPLNHVSPLTYRPFGGPYAPLWSHVASGIEFNLDTLQIDFSNPNVLVLSGTGLFTGPNHDDTPGLWNMTLNIATGAVSGSFSSSSSVPVPEPATTALFGLAMLGAGAVARRRRQARVQA